MPDNDQRPNLKDRIIILLALMAVLIFIISDFGDSQGRYYDCRDAHWHPDYPVQVKEECRKIIREHLEQQKKEELERKIIRT